MRLGIVILLLCAATATATQRPFTIDDLFEIEDIGRYYGGPYAFSPDGKQLAFTRVRPKKSLANHKWEYLWGNAGGDIWLQAKPGDAPINITNGVSDGSGWWSPQWSADGTRLAMLSTRGGNACVWVWNARTRELKQLSQRASSLRDVHERPYLWVDNQHLLYPALAPGDQPLGMAIELQTPQIASREWPKVIRGEQPTANVLESGVPVDPGKRSQDDLLLIDVETGHARQVTHATARSWQLSPDRRTIAYTKEVSAHTPKPNEPLALEIGGVSTLAVARIDGSNIQLPANLSQDVLVDSVRWSEDGQELAFLGYGPDRSQPPKLFRLRLADSRLTEVALKDLDAAPIVRQSTGLEWTRRHELLVYAARVEGSARPAVTARRDWWLISGTHSENLTQKLQEPPRELWPQDGRTAFVGAGAGAIWKVDTERRSVVDLTSHAALKVRSISWPAATNEGVDEYRIPDRTYREIVFSAEAGSKDTFYRLDLVSARLTALHNPSDRAKVVAYEPNGHSPLFWASDRTGSRVWRDAAPILETNTFLNEIAESEFRSIDYISQDGEKLKGWLMLPPDYQAGKRYPLLTWVYAGSVYTDRRPTYEGIDQSVSLNLQIAAAHGYAVLLPSMPLAPEGVADDPMLRLTNGVIPAVDKAIELGIGDPDRLYLMGQSFGGFSTYGLVTQTHRFRSAVALAGLSDLISLYGQFDARERYADNPQEHLFMAALMETAQTRMGNPPWKDLGRYIRNSPVFFVDRVQTPLMIIQGDVDYVALQQGEEFFNSLYRQGKRAEFVRYWGEGHVLESPANIRDMWQRIFTWFDRSGVQL